MRETLAALVLAASLAGPGLAVAGDLAVVVNAQSAETGLSGSELRDILLMERQHWRRGGRIHLLLPQTGTSEKVVLLRRAFKMSEEQLRRHYLEKLYGGDIPAFPRAVATSADACRLVGRTTSALAVVDASTVDASVKVLAIDGRRPGDPGYLLAAR